MARAMWTGFLSFGLVNVPVGLYAATEDRTVHFNQLHKGTSNRIRYKKVDEETGEEVESSDIVNGYHLGGGEYVVVDKEDLKQAAPGRSELIEISDFIELDQVDPIFFKQSYYLAPRGKGADRAYALLRQAMLETNKVGIASFVMRDKEHLVAVRPGTDVLTLETMYFADEIRDPKEELDLPAPVELAERELNIAKQLIESLSAEWEPSRYENTYKARVEALIEEKRQGHVVTVQSEAPKSNVIDLMAALEASVAKSQESRAQKSAAAPATAEQQPAAAAASATQQQFEGMSKAELLERAAELNVQGRSKMSKLELVEALAGATESEAEAPAPKARRRRAS